MNRKTNLEEQKPKKVFFSTKALYLIWLLCLIYFLSTIIFAKSYSDSSSTLMLLAILIGGVAFLELFFRVVQPKRFNSGKYILITFLTLVAFFGMLVNEKRVRALFGILSRTEINQSIDIDKSNQVTPATITPSKNINQENKEVNIVPRANANLIDCTGPDGKVFKTTQKECDEFNTAWNNTTTEAQINQSDLIDCKLSYGTFSINAELCDYYQGLDNNTQNNYQPPSTENYNLPIQQEQELLPEINNLELRQACFSEVASAYQQELSQTLSYLSAQGLGGSAVERAKKSIKDKYDALIRDCEIRYPN